MLLALQHTVLSGNPETIPTSPDAAIDKNIATQISDILFV